MFDSSILLIWRIAMKITATFLLLLGSIGIAFAQDTPTQATTNAQTEPPPATSPAPAKPQLENAELPFEQETQP